MYLQFHSESNLPFLPSHKREFPGREVEDYFPEVSFKKSLIEECLCWEITEDATERLNKGTRQ